MDRLEPFTSADLALLLEMLNTSTVQLPRAEEALTLRARVEAHYNAQLIKEVQEYHARTIPKPRPVVEEYVSPLAAAGGIDRPGVDSVGSIGMGGRVESGRAADVGELAEPERDPEPTPANGRLRTIRDED